ncbi:putative tpr domain protein [Diaporthe ampelina]|uniref:Putative tpr domain protein n=1 Tax=Diaporthe ampelina TaxID=1214573 RepID=A0A0G2FY35_9PEZI|nr:putative tpr domain protein [Diaporthe ampelina]
MSLQALSTYDYLKLATLCFNRGYQNTAESVADYARQRLSRPELHTEASVRLVELYINLKRTAKAQALFTRMKTAAKPSVTRGFSISFRKLDARMRELNGRADEAITMLRNAMTEEDVEKRNSPSENVTMGALEDLVNCLIRKHNYEMAEPLLRRQLLTFERVYGSNSPAAIGILEKLSSVFLAQGNLEDTEDALVRVNESNKARLGVDHPKTQACALELAGILDQRGQHDQASKLYDCALELFEGWHGPADPDSLKVRIRRAECFEARQMNEEALKDYRMALEACEKEAGVERRTHNQDIDELKGMLMRYLAAPDEVLEQHIVSKRGAVLSKSSILSS